MKAWLIDAYRHKDKIILWLKTPEDNIRLEKNFTNHIYLESKEFLDKQKLRYIKKRKQTYLREWKDVYEVQTPIHNFEKFVGWIEYETKHRLVIYNADIAPEQMFLYKNNLIPCSPVEIVNNEILPIKDDFSLPLEKIELDFPSQGPIIWININNENIKGEESTVLKKFIEKFEFIDPDVIVMEHAFSSLPRLFQRLQEHKLFCRFHRWDHSDIKYKGGKSFFSYGNIVYRDYAVRLKGRFLIDLSTMIGTECNIDGIIELCQLSGARFQQVASRSFGAVFQLALVRQMVAENMLIPFKEKPVDPPISMFEMLKFDRIGHTFDSKTGFHIDVAEIDFSSMFPWLIYNHNISTETILSEKGPFENIPGLPFRISLKYKGLTPKAIKPFLDRRMFYKKNPTYINKAKAQGLKWILVTSYGYLRFREFKLGMASTHMAIGSFAREILLKAAKCAEDLGFEIVHGIVDSLYIKKSPLNENEVKNLCRELEFITGIPLSYDLFKWIVFLPSINEDNRPAPTHYYGIYKNRDIKVRGIELRQLNTPKIIKDFQQEIIESLTDCNSKQDIIAKFPMLSRLLKKTLKKIPDLDVKWLTCSVKISKTHYKNNIPQKKILKLLEERGIRMKPGQKISYVIQEKGITLPEAYNGRPDISYYKKLLVRALYIVLQPFGITRERILESIGERQTKIPDFIPRIKYVYVPLSKRYSSMRGMSEKILRKRLEKHHWTVWKGALIGYHKKDVYPNIKKKYQKLDVLLNQYYPKYVHYLEYICSVHHGMPDFICYRNGQIKFIECKLGHESLSQRQKKCIEKLTGLGFLVEIHKLVNPCTKTRVATVNIYTNEKVILDKQALLKF